MKTEDNGIAVFISSRESICSECGENLGPRAWIALAKDKGALCLECADLAHLVFLPSGNMALTRRAKKNSQLHSVVLKWSKARKRYERQGLLVEEHALEMAETECLAGAEVRQRRRIREAERRDIMDREYVRKYAEQILRYYPRIPRGLEVKIAEHACQKYSERVGRSKEAKGFNEKPITLSVVAHIRHTKTAYDELLMRGVDRYDARKIISAKVDQVLEKWRETA
jgi:hypothetical protein